jgi:hypothetical protein
VNDSNGLAPSNDPFGCYSIVTCSDRVPRPLKIAFLEINGPLMVSIAFISIST